MVKGLLVSFHSPRELAQYVGIRSVIKHDASFRISWPIGEKNDLQTIKIQPPANERNFSRFGNNPYNQDGLLDSAPCKTVKAP